jgi:hypothetical protein
VSFTGKKAPWLFFFLFLLFLNKWKLEHQSESNSATSWTTNPWKSSLSHTALREALCCFSRPVDSKDACVNLQNEQVSIMHYVQFPYPLPGNIIQHRPWANLIPLPTVLKTVNYNVTPTAEAGWNAELAMENGGGGRSQTFSTELSGKADSGGGVMNQPPKVGQVVDPGDDFWDRGQHSKLNCPTLLEEELTKQLQLKGNTAATW